MAETSRTSLLLKILSLRHVNALLENVALFVLLSTVVLSGILKRNGFRAVICGIYEEFQKLGNNTINNPIKKWMKE